MNNDTKNMCHKPCMLIKCKLKTKYMNVLRL